MLKLKEIFINTSILLVSSVLMLAIVEGIVRLKNADMSNYNIEMWRYAKELKVPSQDPLLGHEHIYSKEAELQGVKIRLNNFGLRGSDIEIGSTKSRRILFLGSSATLGWGVEESETMTALLDQHLGHNVEVLNAGIGNYNAERYIELFLTKLKVLAPTDIVINYFLNDTEILSRGNGNWLLQHSELAVMAWEYYNKFSFNGFSLEEYYKHLYDKNFLGYQKMASALDRLATYSQKNNIHVYVAITPDMHTLDHYNFQYIHKIIETEAEKRGFEYIDLLEGFQEGKPAKTYWAMPTDPHPNAIAHKRMANVLYKHLSVEN